MVEGVRVRVGPQCSAVRPKGFTILRNKTSLALHALCADVYDKLRSLLDPKYLSMEKIFTIESHNIKFQSVEVTRSI